MAVTLNLNAKTNDVIQLDPQFESWLNIIKNNSVKRPPCTFPKRYFEILFAWGYVAGTPGSA
jgi:hypothetical protein